MSKDYTEKTAKNTIRRGRPFVKNDPRINRNGRPKGSGISITTEIKRKLKEMRAGEQKTNLQKLIEVILDKAIIKKDEQIIKQIWNYIDGLPTMPHEHTGSVEFIVKTTDETDSN